MAKEFKASGPASKISPSIGRWNVIRRLGGLGPDDRRRHQSDQQRPGQSIVRQQSHRPVVDKRQRHSSLDPNGPGDTGQLQVVAASGSTAAQQLGLVPSGPPRAARERPREGRSRLGDRSQSRPGRWRVQYLGPAAKRVGNQRHDRHSKWTCALSNDQDRLNLAHSTLGEQEQSLSNIQTQLTSTATSLQSSLSQNVDVDMAQVISQLTEAQTSMEASLQTTALVSKLTLLNYL